MTHTAPLSTTLRLMILVLLGGFFFPGNAHAYFTTGQEAFEIDGGSSAVFLIDYSFGVGKHALHMPVLTERGAERKDSTLSYEVIDANGNSAGGKAVGVVLSDTSLLGTEYLVPKGTAKRFTLLVAFSPAEPGEYRLQVTQLPFSFDGAQQLQLNPSELRYYTTKLISLR